MRPLFYLPVLVTASLLLFSSFLLDDDRVCAWLAEIGSDEDAFHPALHPSKLQQHPELRHRQLFPKAWKRGEQIGTVMIDFYRTFEYKGIWFLQWQQHSITKLRVYKELKAINKWYAGRIVFKMGDIISYDNPRMHVTTDGCDAPIKEFATSDDVRNVDRISAVYVKRQGGFVTSTCNSGDFVPLGSSVNTTRGIAPAVLVGMSYNNFPAPLIADIPLIGFPTIGGGTFSHRIAHLIGIEHTKGGFSGGVHVFNQCGLSLRYPYFGSSNNDVVDGVTGDTYKASEWKGTANILGPLSISDILLNFKDVGLFQPNYAPVFEEIVRCWYNSSVTIT